MTSEKKEIWTVGHSTRTIEEFIQLLQSCNINLLADVRSFPGSRRYPHFNKTSLPQLLKAVDIDYAHLPKLGGRRKAKPDSENTTWRNESFRGYADYMETDQFREGIEELYALAERHNVAIMCSEAVWWRCHRSMVSDYLKAAGWNVYHILNINKVEEHPYTSPAHLINGKLSYKDITTKTPDSLLFFCLSYYV